MTRIDPKTIWGISIAFHAGWAVVLAIRHDLFESSPIYAAFVSVMSTPSWGAACAITALLLLLGLRCRSVMLAAHLLSALMMLLIAVTFTVPNGINTATVTYAVLGAASMYAYYRDAAIWLALKFPRKVKNG